MLSETGDRALAAVNESQLIPAFTAESGRIIVTERAVYRVSYNKCVMYRDRARNTFLLAPRMGSLSRYGFNGVIIVAR